MMKTVTRTLSLFGSIVVALILSAIYIPTVNAQVEITGEHIQSYDVTIDIQKNGKLSINERIIYDFGSQQRHGIRRWIPLRFKDGEKQLQMGISNIEVSMDNASEPYKVSSSNGIDEIKIGDPNRTITGKRTYEIRYIIAGGMRYFDDHDELYWDVIGQNWDVPILESHVTIAYPSHISSDAINAVCFTGVEGSKESDCQVVIGSDITDVRVLNPLATGEGLTIAVKLPAGTVDKLLPEEYVPFSETFIGRILLVLGTIVGVVLAILWYIVYPLWIVIRWYLYGRDPKIGVDITAYFEGPSVGRGHLTPAETGGLIDEKVDRRDLVALLVDLARRGYLRIEEREKKDFYLMRTEKQQKSDVLLDFEEKILNVFFSTGDEVRIKDIKNITSELLEIENEIYGRLMSDGLFVKNPKKVRDHYALVTAAAMMTFNVQLILVSALFGNAMPRKTLAGAKAAHQARGLQNFLTSQGRQLNYQGNMQMLFEKLLPYAVAFGVEKNWIDRFKHIGIEVAQPTWYVGQSSFASSFHSFNSVARASSYTSTTSSYSSSGFSGGSSGGGGGGGGGGSW